MRTKTETENGHKVDLDKFMADLKTVVQDGQELLRASASVAKDKARIGCETTDRAIRSHPYETLAVCFGAGLLVGLLMSRGFSSEYDSGDL